MILDIGFEDRDDRSRALGAKGFIRIGNHRETFGANLVILTRKAYILSWIAALERFVGGSPKTALLVDYFDCGGQFFGTWWPLYRVHTKVVLQNHLILRDVVGDGFNPMTLDRSVPDYAAVNEEGERISAWETDMLAVQACVDRLRRRYQSVRRRRWQR